MKMDGKALLGKLIEDTPDDVVAELLKNVTESLMGAQVDALCGEYRVSGLPVVDAAGVLLGIIMLGLIGTTAVNPAGANGLLFGGGDFFVKQVVAVLVSSIYAFGFTWVMLWLIDRTTPVKTTEAQEKTLDESLHGEQAYLA